MMFEEIDSGKEKRRKRISDKRHERRSHGRRHAKRRSFIRHDLFKDANDDGRDVFVSGDSKREGK